MCWWFGSTSTPWRWGRSYFPKCRKNPSHLDAAVCPRNFHWVVSPQKLQDLYSYFCSKPHIVTRLLFMSRNTRVALPLDDVQNTETCKGNVVNILLYKYICAFIWCIWGVIHVSARNGKLQNCSHDAWLMDRQSSAKFLSSYSVGSPPPLMGLCEEPFLPGQRQRHSWKSAYVTQRLQKLWTKVECRLDICRATSGIRIGIYQGWW